MWVPRPGDHDALSDEALLAGLGVGEADTGAAFVRRFQRRTFGLALSIVSDPGLNLKSEIVSGFIAPPAQIPSV